jgi:hypothetical protein
MKLFKYILIVVLTVLISCTSVKKDFYNRKHPKETRNSYSEKKGLMLLNNNQLGRNKYIASQRYQNKLKKVHKKYHKQ